MSDAVGLLLTFLLEIVVFFLINFLAIKNSYQNFRKRIWAGIIFLLLTPVVFFGTLYFVAIYDESGWGAGGLAVIFTGLYILNGMIVLLSSVAVYLKAK